MKKLIVAAVIFAGVVMGGGAWAQETTSRQPNLDMFYGSKDFGGIDAKYRYYATTPGVAEALDFYYLTKSKRSEGIARWTNYYGVDAELGLGEGSKYHFSKGDASFQSYWFFIWLDDKLFTQDTGKVRPYIDFGGGAGMGQYHTKALKEDNSSKLDVDWSDVTYLGARAGGGVEFMLSGAYALDVGLDIDGQFGLGGSLLKQSTLALGGVSVNVGLCKWSEKK